MMTRYWLFLVALVLCSSAAAQGPVTVVDHHDDAALFIVPTANVVEPARPVESVAEYVAVYGRSSGTDFGALAAAQFFANGGHRLYAIDPGGSSAGDFRRALAASTALPVSLVALPGASCCIGDPATLRSVMKALIQHVATSPNRFAVIDAPENSGAAGLKTYRTGLDSTYAALYAPWLVVDDSSASAGRRPMPPSAAVAGVIARTDRTRGMFKSPAGTRAELSAILNPALGRDLGPVLDYLNPKSINVLHQITPGNNPMIWGARVLDPGGQPYVSRYRYLRHLEHSIDTSLRAWLTSAAPGPSIAAAAEASIKTYLDTQWRRGALQGANPQHAYFSNCQFTGSILDCQVGVSLIKPAEFDVFNVQWRSAKKLQKRMEQVEPRRNLRPRAKAVQAGARARSER
ncbi:phage tail sheath subtilisin-like domain-containing protein [Lysobacter sp. A286]